MVTTKETLEALILDSVYKSSNKLEDEAQETSVPYLIEFMIESEVPHMLNYIKMLFKNP